MSSKFVIGDPVRVTNPNLQEFDRVGVVTGYAEIACESASQVQLDGIAFSVPFKQSSLTLADPDVHTILDQMDAESAPKLPAFTIGERVMVKGIVGSYGGRFGDVKGSDDDGAIEWNVLLDGDEGLTPFTEDEIVRTMPVKDMAEMEIDGEYVRGKACVSELPKTGVTAVDKLRMIADTVEGQSPFGTELANFRRRLFAILSIGHDA